MAATPYLKIIECNFIKLLLAARHNISIIHPFRATPYPGRIDYSCRKPQIIVRSGE